MIAQVCQGLAWPSNAVYKSSTGSTFLVPSQQLDHAGTPAQIWKGKE
jgi:hypothetical protein